MRFNRVWLLAGAVFAAGCASPEERAARHSKKAVELVAAQRYRAAWGEFEKARESGVACTKADALQGAMLLQRGEIEAGEAMLARAIASEPSNVATRNNLAVAYLVSGRPQDAANALRNAAAESTAPSEVLNNYGLALRSLGDFKGSAQSCREAMRRNPRSSDAASNYAFALYLQGQKEEAVKNWETAVYIQEGNPDALAGLALGKLAIGKLKEAREAVMRAMFIDSTYVNDEVLVNVRNWPAKEAKIVAQLIRNHPRRRPGFYPSPIAMKSFGSAQVMEDPEVARAKQRLGGQ